MCLQRGQCAVMFWTLCSFFSLSFYPFPSPEEDSVCHAPHDPPLNIWHFVAVWITINVSERQRWKWWDIVIAPQNLSGRRSGWMAHPNLGFIAVASSFSEISFKNIRYGASSCQLVCSYLLSFYASIFFLCMFFYISFTVYSYTVYYLFSG